MSIGRAITIVGFVVVGGEAVDDVVGAQTRLCAEPDSAITKRNGNSSNNC